MTRVSILGLVSLLAGCAHSSTHTSSREAASPSVGATAITVYVDGAVNSPGKHDLVRPFTVDHAIQQAGGIDKFEGDWNRKVVVRHRDGQRSSVLRKDYSFFILADGDGVVVPWH